MFNSPACTLGAFKREFGEARANAVMVIILNDLIDFFNVGNTMNAPQVVATAEMILDNYGYLKIDDFKLCFNNAKRGYYNDKVYRIDGNVILTWIERYVNERMNTAEEISYSNHASIKSNERRDESFLEIAKSKRK